MHSHSSEVGGEGWGGEKAKNGLVDHILLTLEQLGSPQGQNASQCVNK